ncbi:MAG TPA: hypothetical protein VKD71_01800 [Gemmataceae bacterium]|nr:hypothetical protein [Gemmataceae bacterium]
MYALTWSARALDQLAELYVTLPLEEQRRLAAAVDAFNNRLKSQPLDEGESRGDDLRITFTAGLTARFRVNEVQRTVRVTYVKRYGR